MKTKIKSPKKLNKNQLKFVNKILIKTNRNSMKNIKFFTTIKYKNLFIHS